MMQYQGRLQQYQGRSQSFTQYQPKPLQTQPRRLQMCYNCSRYGHIARECRDPPKFDPNNSFQMHANAVEMFD
jgi:hypothetical protein